MRISVVVIVFNLESYVGEAIDSVLRQTRTADEVIVVDDCSTDRSADRVEAYGDRVRYLRMPENSGALFTALRGVKAASGDVVCMLDADDYWASNKLEVVEREFLADPELMLLSHEHVRVDEQGVNLGSQDETHRNIVSLRRRARSRDHLSDLLKESILDQKGYWLGSAYSFRRTCFDIREFESQIAIFGFDRLKQTYLDLVIAPFLVLTKPLAKVGYTPDTSFAYRVHPKGSLSGNVTPEKARRSAAKGRTINELIDLILRENEASPKHLRRREFILQEYDFLSALYAGALGRTARLYLRLACRHWNMRQLKKETMRLMGVALLGPKKFLTLKEGQTRT
jgi:glycosyltransferase involved in cell wall biosynthesis